MSESDAKLADLRDRIDDIDRRLVELLSERAKLVMDIGRAKRALGAPTYAPDREREVLDRIKALNSGPLSQRSLVAIYRELMSGSFVLERPPRVAYLGPPGSFSHLAALRKFGASIEYEPVGSIAAIFDEIAREHVDLGLVPVENSIGGGVVDTLDALAERNCIVCAEVNLAVHLHLFGHRAIEDVELIHSKPEVFTQCQKWLMQTGFAGKTVAAPSSSKAAEIAASQPNAACIGSELIGELYALVKLRDRIEDDADNMTRFLVIGRTAAPPSGKDKTAIVFSAADKPGALVEVLDVLRKGGINMTYIESRPSRKRNWEYGFFVEFQGHIEDAAVAQAVAAARAHCSDLRVLGSFPKAQEVL